MDFLMPLASTEQLHLTEDDLKANRFALEVGNWRCNSSLALWGRAAQM